MMKPDPVQLAEVRRMIGKPWADDGIGPDFFHCWGVIVHLYKRFNYADLPAFSAINPRDAKAVCEAIETVKEVICWHGIEKPEHFCGVAMGRGRKLHHVGLYLDWDSGYVLHAAEGDKVLCPTLAGLRNQGWGRMEFYKYINHG